MKDQILLLRAEGKSYREIEKLLGCSKGTISFHCGDGQKQKYYATRQRGRADFRNTLKHEAGGKCSLCGYDKCMEALDFHHSNAAEKVGEVSQLLISNGYQAARAEAAKCALICANCHREVHFNDR